MGAKKPAPDVFLLALARLGLSADTALAIEDSENGILSARAAGLAVVVTPSAYTRDEIATGAFAADVVEVLSLDLVLASRAQTFEA